MAIKTMLPINFDSLESEWFTYSFLFVCSESLSKGKFIFLHNQLSR